ncbi:hypothetical protein AMELA_G00231030 [Ameiurus melas]|uniref:Uncharacterized protein n=1 Tax=Ameiurus melas TaxID=219545 RepID=A0A7J5ZX79_AMEME|nr:hypothetical protein AMELA_G00231030 [Ameiurus melas]
MKADPSLQRGLTGLGAAVSRVSRNQEEEFKTKSHITLLLKQKQKAGIFTSEESSCRLQMLSVNILQSIRSYRH